MKVFRFNISSGLNSLDPAYAAVQSNVWVVNLMYNGLVQTDDSLNVIPCIAKRWNISADGLTYTFYLRNDVHFYDSEVFPNRKGRTVTADDFVYSFNRIIDPEVASKGSWIFIGKVDEKEPFKAIDDTIFQMKLKKVFTPMLSVLTMSYCKVVPHEAIDKYKKDFRIHGVGTGPFQLNHWKENDVLVLLQNPHYFEKDESGKRLPYLDAVSISFIANKSTEFLKFKQKELDLISDIDPNFKDDVLTKSGELQQRYNKVMKLLKGVYLNSEFIGINTQSKDINSPLRDVRVRKAINYAIDRNKLVTYMRNNIGKPAVNGFVTPGLAGYNVSAVKGYEYNPVMARKLLNDAGFPNGKGMKPLQLFCTTNTEAISTFVAAELNEIGIPVKVSVLDGRAIAEMKIKGEADFFRGSWVADYPDAETFLAVFYGGYGAPPNYTRFNNHQFNLLYDKATSTVDLTERNAIYEEMDRIEIEQAPVVPLYYDEIIRFVQPNVTGLSNNAENLLELKRVDFNRN